MAFDDYIIDIYLNIPTNLVCKHFFHPTLGCCPDILKTEWHLPVVEGATIGMKGHFILIFSSHPDLMIDLVGIKKALELKSF